MENNIIGHLFVKISMQYVRHICEMVKMLLWIFSSNNKCVYE